MEKDSNKNNKKKRIPKPVKRFKMEPANLEDIDFEWDFGPHSSELNNTATDYSRPSTSKQSEDTTLISEEHQSRVTCHLNDEESSSKSVSRSKQLYRNSVSAPNIVQQTKNRNLPRKLSASAPTLTTSTNQEMIFRNSSNSSISSLPFWNTCEFLNASGDMKHQKNRKKVRYNGDSSDSDDSIKPWYHSCLITIHPRAHFRNHPRLNASFWNHCPVEAASSTSNSITSSSTSTLGSICVKKVEPFSRFTTTNNIFFDCQQETSTSTYMKQFRDHVMTKPTLQARFTVQKVNSSDLSHPPMAPPEYIDTSGQLCKKEERKSLNNVQHTRYPRLKSLKRAIDKFFGRLAHLIRRLKAVKGNCLSKPQKTD